MSLQRGSLLLEAVVNPTRGVYLRPRDATKAGKQLKNITILYRKKIPAGRLARRPAGSFVTIGRLARRPKAVSANCFR